MSSETEISQPNYKFEDLLKPPQAAQLLGISKSHLRGLTSARRIPAIDLGRAGKHMWRYHAPTIQHGYSKR